ncbi:MAG: prepilin-type N-terminal cleavage/methylation domain-containing protein [Patescibacteria group bacterium]|nr:prepilin-type N-terminal cleavage/methylation domain-containing protein [Patescibacteria group bacterium]
MFFCLNKDTNNKGFTLIEIMLSVALFSILIVAVLNIFHYSAKAHEKILNSQEILNQTSYIMEYMSRSIRMAQKDIDGDCSGATGKTYNSGDDSIKFINYDGFCQEFYLDGNILKQSIDDSTGVPLISSEFKVNLIKFEILGDEIGDNIQPRITIFLDIESDTTDIDKQTQVKIQTSVSQRNLDM